MWWKIAPQTFLPYRWGRRDPVIVKGRCAFMSSSCYRLPPKGSDPKTLHHMCGPSRMGIGWRESGEEKEDGRDLVWVRGKDGSWTDPPRIVLEKNVKMEVLSLAEMFDKVVTVDPEQGRRRASVQNRCNLERKFVEGGRNPKIVEEAVKQHNLSRPASGRKPLLRLKLENFTRVGLKYPPSKLQCNYWRCLD